MTWLGLALTKKNLPFDHNRLEEVTYYQYGYGGSTDVINQAGQFLTGLRKLRPFPEANDACAFVATVAFLAMNGGNLLTKDDAGAKWYEEAVQDVISARLRIQSDCGKCEPQTEVRLALAAAIDRYPKTVKALKEQEPVDAFASTGPV